MDCQDRNGNISSYRIIYYSFSNPIDVKRWTVSGTRNTDRITGLVPNNSYTFMFEAINMQAGFVGVPATVDVSTTAPQSNLIAKILEKITIS